MWRALPGGITLAAGASLSQTADMTMTNVASYGSHLHLTFSSMSPRSVWSDCVEFCITAMSVGDGATWTQSGGLSVTYASDFDQDRTNPPPSNRQL
jgi:hypothetical protein